jgi:transcriptional regulator NrdR family protein
MKCTQCGSEKTKVVSTEKGHRITGRFQSLDKMKTLSEEWGDSTVFRQRTCETCKHRFVTIEFCPDA